MYFLEAGQRRWLTSLNPLLIMLLALSLILLKTTGETMMPGSFRRWDPLLVLVIYLGQRRTTREGCLLIIFAAHLFSLSSAAPIGVFVIQYLILFVVSRLLSYVFYAETSVAALAMIAGFSLFSRITLPLIAGSFGHGWPILSFQNWGFSSLVLNCFLGMLVYGLLSGLDAVTFKVPPHNLEMSET